LRFEVSSIKESHNRIPSPIAQALAPLHTLLLSPKLTGEELESYLRQLLNCVGKEEKKN